MTSTIQSLTSTSSPTEAQGVTDGPFRYAPLEFLGTLPGLSVVLIVVLVLAALVGTFGNLLILVAVATNKELQNVESVFVVNLACCDLYVTLIADPLSIVGKTLGWEFFDTVPGLCRAVGSLCTVSCVGSLMTLSAMSCNRYVLIVHPAHYRRVFTVRHSVLMCCCFYLVGFLLVCLNFFGVGDHSFDHKSLECFWDRMANHNYTIVFAVIMVWVPIIVTAVSYSKLFLHVRRVRMKVHSHGNNRSNAQVSNPGNDLEDNGGSNVENGQENHASDFVNSHENQDNGQCSSMTIAASNNAGKDGNKTEVQSDHNQGKPINLEEGDAKENDGNFQKIQTKLSTVSAQKTGGHIAGAVSNFSHRTEIEPEVRSASSTIRENQPTTSDVKTVKTMLKSKSSSRTLATGNPTLKLARGLFIIYVVFSACWVPFSLLMILDADDSFAHELHVVIVVWAHLHPSVNWVVYYHTNSKFRKAFRGLFSFKDG